MMVELQTTKPARATGWYWFTSDDGIGTGPFATAEEAQADMVRDGFAEDQINVDFEDDDPDRPTPEAFAAGWEFIWRAARPAISTDCFDARRVLEEFEEKNEEAVWGDVPPDWPQATRELELMLADALFRWAEKHGAWEQFRALADAPADMSDAIRAMAPDTATWRRALDWIRVAIGRAGR